MKTVYQTPDGCVFLDEEEAWEHEAKRQLVSDFMEYYMNTPTIYTTSTKVLCADIERHLSEFLKQSNYQITKE